MAYTASGLDENKSWLNVSWLRCLFAIAVTFQTTMVIAVVSAMVLIILNGLGFIQSPN